MNFRLAAAAIAATTSLIALTTGAMAADPATTKTEPAAPEVKPLVAWPEPNLDWQAGGFDYAFGAKFQSSYVNRGMSMTANRPSASVYGELRYGWLYAGVQPWNVKIATDASLELDVFAGFRPVWGPLSFDFGVIGYLYPDNTRRWWINGAAGSVANFRSPGAIPTTPQDPTYIEAYWKAAWAINDYLTVGGNFYYSPNWANTGAESLYSEINGKITLPDTGFSISGAYGWQYIGRSNKEYGFSYVDPQQYYTGVPRGFKYTSYNYWNIGGSYNWKQITFDVRYHGNNLGSTGCANNTSDPSANWAFSAYGVGRSTWCGNKVVAGISLDFTSASFKPDLPGGSKPAEMIEPPNSADR